MDRTGVTALPILGLLSFLIGVVLAYQGADQLRRFGAEIFTVNLLGVGILRELGVLLTAIIVAGRSGSAFTAEIGAMQVNEEIDAMRTLGLDPVEVLVLPRLFGLVVMLPLLTSYADFMSLLGGGLMSWVELDIRAAAVPPAAASRRSATGPSWSASRRRRSLLPRSRSSAAMPASRCRAAPRVSAGTLPFRSCIRFFWSSLMPPSRRNARCAQKKNEAMVTSSGRSMVRRCIVVNGMCGIATRLGIGRTVYSRCMRCRRGPQWIVMARIARAR